jgi:maleylpyruvate isomerase
MTRPALPVTLDWLAAGERHLARLVDRLTDHEAVEPSRLPGWTRAQLVTHLARNADALVNLLTWANTGVPTPMYRSAEHRAADIAVGAGRPAAAVRADLAAAAERLATTAAELPEPAWRAVVRTGHGREITADQVPWLRVREVWVHAADLGLGATLADLPSGLTDALLDEVAATFTSRGTDFTVRLRDPQRSRSWQVGQVSVASATGLGRPVEVSGTGPELLGWLIGRAPMGRLTVSPAGAVPAPPPWI